MARPELPMWFFPPLEVRPPPPNQSRDINDCLASCWDQSNCLCPLFPFPVGKVGPKAIELIPAWCQKIVYACCSSSSWHCHPRHDGVVAVNAQVSSLLLRWQLLLLSQWCCCPCQCTGISAVVELVLLPLLIVVYLMSLPMLWWRFCHQCAGIFAVVAIAIVAFMTMVSLLLLMRKCPCPHWAGIIALVTMASLPLIRNSIVALVTMVSIPPSSWHHCPCCNDIVVIINAQASLPSLQWHYCPCCDGVVAVDAQASLPLLQ